MFNSAYAWLSEKAISVWNKLKVVKATVFTSVAYMIKEHPVFTFLVALCVISSPFSELAAAILFLVGYIAFWIVTWFTIWNIVAGMYSSEPLGAAIAANTTAHVSEVPVSPVVETVKADAVVTVNADMVDTTSNKTDDKITTIKPSGKKK